MLEGAESFKAHENSDSSTGRMLQVITICANIQTNRMTASVTFTCIKPVCKKLILCDLHFSTISSVILSIFFPSTKVILNKGKIKWTISKQQTVLFCSWMNELVEWKIQWLILKTLAYSLKMSLQFSEQGII